MGSTRKYHLFTYLLVSIFVDLLIFESLLQLALPTAAYMCEWPCASLGPARSSACLSCGCRCCTASLQRRGWGRVRSKKRRAKSKARERQDANTDDGHTTPMLAGPTLLTGRPTAGKLSILPPARLISHDVSSERSSSCGAIMRSSSRSASCGRMVGPGLCLYDKSSFAGTNANRGSSDRLRTTFRSIGH